MKILTVEEFRDILMDAYLRKTATHYAILSDSHEALRARAEKAEAERDELLRALKEAFVMLGVWAAYNDDSYKEKLVFLREMNSVDEVLKKYEVKT